MSVKLIMFNNGLQVIGEYERKVESEGVAVIKKPVQLVMMPKDAVQPGQVGMAFAPFLQYATEWETGVSFLVTDMLTVVTPVTELLNSYNTTFGSGLVLPPGIGQGR